ncbi:MAG: hypothetical protein Tsb002_24090 [Wenzhouxiangellaceae bacterium]
MNRNRNMLIVLGVVIWAFSPSIVSAAFKDTDNVTVELISVWVASGDILVQTNPKPDITGLGCTNDFWLTLDKDDLGYEATLSMLLSAQVSRKNIIVRADDTLGGEFCRLTRVSNKAN